MANTAVKILNETYKIEKEKLFLIHHGIPQVEFQKDNTNIKDLLNLNNKTILTTFGLINRGKGIEYVIQALPELVKKYPNLLYLIIGETHPNIRKEEGEVYRKKLIELINKLNLKNNVKFYNKYLSLEEIITYLKATDIYIYPALETNQIVSGTLAYAIGAGKAVIATPSLYAKEILNHNRGLIVKLKDSESMNQALDKILKNKELKQTLEKNAYDFSREMLWPNVARKYLEIFKKITDVSQDIGLYTLPKVKLNHLITMTDDTGIIQHAKHSLPNRFTGYCLDDNSRALITAIQYYNLKPKEKLLNLINIYLGFLHYAQKEDGHFQDFMSYEKKFLELKSGEDSFGRTIWAIGFLLSSKIHNNLKSSAKFIFENSIKNIDNLKNIRSQAFTILGLYYYYKNYSNEDILIKIKILADKIIKAYEENSTEDWKWFEKKITYSNGKLPEALFLAYDLTNDKKYLKIAEETLSFLSSLVILNNKLVLIGQNGWYLQGKKRAYYDQQPVDASSMVSVYTVAFKITKNKDYFNKAFLSYSWFLGNNSIEQTIYDEFTGGCYDGLRPNCINLNQGSESTISYLLARLNLEDLKKLI